MARITVPLLLLLLSGGLAAQDDEFCFTCNGEFLVPCEDRKCKKVDCKLDVEHKCAKQFGLKCCRGTKKVPCKICKGRGKKASHEEELKYREEWLQQNEALNKKLGVKTMMHIETPHWRLHYDIKKIKVGMKTFDRDKGMHLYAKRLEELYDDWVKLLGEPYQLPRDGTWVVYVAKNEKDEARIGQTVIGGRATKQFGPNTSTYIVGFNKGDFPRDELLHANIYHHASHLITQQGSPLGSTIYPGWVTEGLAHWLEIWKFGDRRNHCTGEVATKDRWTQPGDWKSKVYSLARREKEPKLASWCQRGIKQMNPMQHGLAWSIVDFLMARHRDKAGDIVRAATSGMKSSAIIRETLGWSLAKFHAEWRSYVEQAYGR